MRKLTTAAIGAALCAWTAAALAQSAGNHESAKKQQPASGRELATPTQKKSAYEPQQPVPGDTPQETSTKANSDGSSTAKDQGRAQENSGSSTADNPKDKKAE
jgi:hypothetical protein